MAGDIDFSIPQEEIDRYRRSVQRSKDLLFTVEHAVSNMLASELPHLHAMGFDDEEEFDDQRSGEFFLRLTPLLEEAIRSSIVCEEHLMILKGFEFPNPFGLIDIAYAKFPREAYYQWWKDDPHGLPCPAWFDDLRKDGEATEADGAAEVCEADIEVDNVPPPEELSPLKPEELPDNGCVEVVPGVTVSDLRAMLDCNSPMYCPRLLAAILTKIDVMPDEQKDNDGLIRLPLVKEQQYREEVKDAAKEHLKALGVISCTDKSRDPSPADGDCCAVERVLRRTLNSKNGRPKNL